MADEAPSGPGKAVPDTPDASPADGERGGDFERYALLAALTLVVLCLLIWDRWHDAGSSAGVLPPPDRTLRVRIGGDPDPNAPPREAPKKEVTNDAPPVPPAPPPAPRRTYQVKSGDNLNDIARRELGAASRAQEIAELNGLADPSKLKVHQVLELPAK